MSISLVTWGVNSRETEESRPGVFKKCRFELWRELFGFLGFEGYGGKF